jgi:hypothetical protein
MRRHVWAKERYFNFNTHTRTRLVAWSRCPERVLRCTRDRTTFRRILEAGVVILRATLARPRGSRIGCQGKSPQRFREATAAVGIALSLALGEPPKQICLARVAALTCPYRRVQTDQVGLHQNQGGCRLELSIDKHGNHNFVALFVHAEEGLRQQRTGISTCPGFMSLNSVADFRLLGTTQFVHASIIWHPSFTEARYQLAFGREGSCISFAWTLLCPQSVPALGRSHGFMS